MRVSVDGDFPGRGSASTAIEVDVELDTDAPSDRVAALLAEVERVAEIPRSLREGTMVTMRSSVTGREEAG
jgi:hypothetical protein